MVTVITPEWAAAQVFWAHAVGLALGVPIAMGAWRATRAMGRSRGALLGRAVVAMAAYWLGASTVHWLLMLRARAEVGLL